MPVVLNHVSLRELLSNQLNYRTCSHYSIIAFNKLSESSNNSLFFSNFTIKCLGKTDNPQRAPIRAAYIEPQVSVSCPCLISSNKLLIASFFDFVFINKPATVTQE